MKTKNLITKKIFTLFSLIFFSIIFLNFSNPSANALGPLLPESSCAKSGTCTMNDFVQLAVELSKMILGVSGAFALLFFVLGGVMFLISGGSQERVTKGKQMIIGSVIGLLIIFGSYTIIGFTLKAMGIRNAEKWFTTDPNK